jgi:hypothetical protein
VGSGYTSTDVVVAECAGFTVRMASDECVPSDSLESADCDTYWLHVIDKQSGNDLLMLHSDGTLDIPDGVTREDLMTAYQVFTQQMLISLYP